MSTINISPYFAAYFINENSDDSEPEDLPSNSHSRVHIYVDEYTILLLALFYTLTAAQPEIFFRLLQIKLYTNYYN